MTVQACKGFAIGEIYSYLPRHSKGAERVFVLVSGLTKDIYIALNLADKNDVRRIPIFYDYLWKKET